MQWVTNKFSSKEKAAIHLSDFVKIFLKPFYDTSIILEQRRTIRDSNALNEFLQDNQEGLKEIFEITKNKLTKPKMAFSAVKGSVL